MTLRWWFHLGINEQALHRLRSTVLGLKAPGDARRFGMSVLTANTQMPMQGPRLRHP